MSDPTPMTAEDAGRVGTRLATLIGIRMHYESDGATADALAAIDNLIAGLRADAAEIGHLRGEVEKSRDATMNARLETERYSCEVALLRGLRDTVARMEEERDRLRGDHEGLLDELGRRFPDIPATDGPRMFRPVLRYLAAIDMLTAERDRLRGEVDDERNRAEFLVVQFNDVKEWKEQVDAELAACRKREARAVEALIWCSGSPSFAPDGEARAGWLKVCQPLIDAALRPVTGAEAIDDQIDRMVTAAERELFKNKRVLRPATGAGGEEKGDG